MTHKNQFFIFGGNSYNGGDERQISTITGCRVQRVGTLSFNHDQGDCSVGGAKVFLCFDNSGLQTEVKTCRYADDPLGEFTEVASSFYNHRSISIASSECK